MKNRCMNVSSATVISTIAIGALTLTGGCKSEDVLLDRPMIPPPSTQDPSQRPVAAQPVLPVVEAPAASPVAVPAIVPK